MREIKFRVWDSNNKEMYPATTIFKEDILMQYIGLKDKNDSEIYADCSIVEFDYLEELHKSVTLKGVFTFNKEELRYEIDILEKYDPYVCLSYDHVLMSNFKIIGNIYEDTNILDI